MSDGYIFSGNVNTCDEYWDMIKSSFNGDAEWMISNAYPGL